MTTKHPTQHVALLLACALMALAYGDVRAENRVGVEINPLWLAASLAKETEFPRISTGISYFLKEYKQYEVALPITYTEYAEEALQLNRLTLKIISGDATVRRYFNRQSSIMQGGYYLGAFARASYISSTIENYDYSIPVSTLSGQVKVGTGISIGLKSVTDNFFWNMNLSVGLYIHGNHGKYDIPKGYSAYPYDQRYIREIDLLRFGYIF